MIEEKIFFIIPSFNPDYNLVKVIKNLRKKNNNFILIIDDGSLEDSTVFFTEILKKFSNITILKHEKNFGKGAALKTAFKYILKERLEFSGVVTLDSDGQHSAEDCVKVLRELVKKPDNFILGYRNFNKNIPLKSYFGNNISKFIYFLLLGKKIKDTQTGLRAFNKNLVKKFLDIKFNGFEFETEQFFVVKNNNIKISEVPIKTIYIENNKKSSFKPVLDSLKIYSVLFKYLSVSMLITLVDFTIFFLAMFFGFHIISSNFLARTVSIFVQFFLLKNFVFKVKKSFKFFLLFVGYVYLGGLVSSYLQIFVIENMSFSGFWAKTVSEFLLFVWNYFFLKNKFFK